MRVDRLHQTQIELVQQLQITVDLLDHRIDDECLAAAREMSDCRHFEVETYAWGVLPAELRQPDLAAGIADEMRWLAQAWRTT